MERRPKMPGRLHWAIVAFMAGFTVLVLLLLAWFIAPGMAVLGDPNATDEDRARIAAVAALLLAVVLVMLFAGLVLTFRIRRYFFHHAQSRQPTKYTDAWVESARRYNPADDATNQGH